MEKLIPTLNIINSTVEPVMFTVMDDVLIIPRSKNSVEAYDEIQDLLHDSDITYIWHENKIIINPELN